MELSQIKELVDSVFKERKLPEIWWLNQDGTERQQKDNLFGLRIYSTDPLIEIPLIEYNGFEVKDDSSRDYYKMREKYWNNAANLITRGYSEAIAAREQFEELIANLDTYYYTDSEPVRYMLFELKYGKEIYNKDKKLFLYLTNDLVYKYPFLLKEQFSANEYLSELIQRTELLKAVYEGTRDRNGRTVIDFYQTYLQETLDGMCRTRLKIEDYRMRIRSINDVLRLTLFNPKSNWSENNIPNWNNLPNEEKDELLIKPHQDVVYEWFQKYKSSMTVTDAYEKLEKRILDKGFKPEDYNLNGTPEHFNRSFNNWVNKIKEIPSQE